MTSPLLYGFPAGASPDTPLQPLPAGPLTLEWGSPDTVIPCWHGIHKTPCGPLALVLDAQGRLCASHFFGRHPLPVLPGTRDDTATATWARRLLAHLESPDRRPWPVRVAGTAFQHAVWTVLADIPPGWFTTYGALARFLGRPRAFRAVGQAVGANPLGGLLPCHRVVGRDRRLGRYHWGPDVKRCLLQREGVTLPVT